jgi:hypothetical protein
MNLIFSLLNPFILIVFLGTKIHSESFSSISSMYLLIDVFHEITETVNTFLTENKLQNENTNGYGNLYFNFSIQIFFLIS